MFTPPVVDSKLLLALPNFDLYCSKLIVRIIPRTSIPITFQLVSLFNQCWVRFRRDAHKKNATRIFATSTKMRNNFSIFGNKLYCPGS